MNAKKTVRIESEIEVTCRFIRLGVRIGDGEVVWVFNAEANPHESGSESKPHRSAFTFTFAFEYIYIMWWRI